MIASFPSVAPSEPQRKLLLAAEKIIGEVGYEAASLRQIASEAGHRNVRAVQYHFENKETIVRTILSMRRAEMDARRTRMFVNSGISLTETDSVELAKYLVVPVMEQKDHTGRRTFARFYRSTIPVLYRFDDWKNLEDTAPFTFKVFEELRARFTVEDDQFWPLKASATAIITFNLIANYDLGVLRQMPEESAFIEELAKLNLSIISTK